MSKIVENALRIGRATSSQIHRLMTNGKGPNGIGAPAVTYIEEINIERKMGVSLDTDAYSKDMAWGSFLEPRVEKMLEFGYQLVSNATAAHPTIKCWAGSKDFIVPSKKVSELKCYQRKKFAQYTDVLLLKDIDILRSAFPAEYWQAVSNAIIENVENAECMTYMPYQSELPEIREEAENYDGPDQWKYRFIFESEDYQLAYLPDGGYYKNLNRFEFKVPQADINLLTERILLVEKMLIDVPA